MIRELRNSFRESVSISTGNLSIKIETLSGIFLDIDANSIEQFDPRIVNIRENDESPSVFSFNIFS